MRLKGALTSTFCVLLASFTANIYLVYKIQDFSGERCIGKSVKCVYEQNHQKLEVASVNVTVSKVQTEDHTKQATENNSTFINEEMNKHSIESHITPDNTKQATNKISTFTNEEMYKHMEQQDSIASEMSGLVRHCITEDILGVIPNSTQTLKFSLSKVDLGETPSDRMNSFEDVFEERLWGKNWDANYKGLSSSGRGSTLHFTQEVIGILHKLINDIKKLKGGNSKVKILDVACGDFVWMSRFLSTRDDVDYTGMDIVKELIDHHKKAYKNKNWKFVHGDIVESDLTEKYDIILCRMLLQHLYAADIKKILKVFSKHSGGLLLATTFSGQTVNIELKLYPGRYREVNLEIPPYSLQPPLCLSRDGMPDDPVNPNVFLGLWKLPLRRVRRCKEIHQVQVKNFGIPIFSCVNWSLTANNT